MMIKNLLIGNSIRNHITRFTLLILSCFIVAYFFMFYSTLNVNTRTTEMFNLNEQLSQLDLTLSNSNANVQKYLDTKDSDAFIAYLDNRKDIQAFIDENDRGLSYNTTELKLTNMSKMLEEYLNESEKAIEYKRARFTTEYIESFAKTEKLTSYIRTIMMEVNFSEIAINIQNHNKLTTSIRELTTVFIMTTVILILLSIIFIFDYTDKIIHPIEELSIYSGQISVGNYTAISEGPLYFDEAKVLLNSFSEMAESIKSYIEDIKDKATTENKLRISEIKNLRIQNSLREAESKALQAQINPHFLYNTLSAGVGLAEYENAERTSEYLYHLATLFRYNLKGLENAVSLRVEIKNIENYYQLMKVRFSDRITFVFNIDEKALDLMIPPLILQPLVENSFIHGFKDKEFDCVVTVTVKLHDQYVIIEILDNGKGISKKSLIMMKNEYQKNSEALFSDIADSEQLIEQRESHTTGLGINNVYSRLKLFFNKSDIFEIASVEGEWTKVIIRIPFEVRDV